MFKHWKNITIYKLSREADLTDLEDKKKMILFTPCGSQDMAKFGFVSPFGDNSEVIAMHGNLPKKSWLGKSNPLMCSSGEHLVRHSVSRAYVVGLMMNAAR
ncbi:recombination-associated protein rdgC [Escherichia coli]|uniref:recombination-associated protein RdgC n=1 Tax=Escherichia coli TaxID=562 RepID=UPI0010B245F1|nr:recombination-associated protein RdgC [Escherichia coli]GCI23082.1 recombination-associated protein rdgC [Escherichia coli]